MPDVVAFCETRTKRISYLYFVDEDKMASNHDDGTFTFTSQ